MIIEIIYVEISLIVPVSHNMLFKCSRVCNQTMNFRLYYDGMHYVGKDGFRMNCTQNCASPGNKAINENSVNCLFKYFHRENT